VLLLCVLRCACALALRRGVAPGQRHAVQVAQLRQRRCDGGAVGVRARKRRAQRVARQRQRAQAAQRAQRGDQRSQVVKRVVAQVSLGQQRQRGNASRAA